MDHIVKTGKVDRVMEIVIIGDVHGKTQQYKQIVDKCDFSICVGDFGFKEEWDWYLNNIVPNSSGFHYINPGNHDYGPYMSDKTKSLGDFSQFFKLGIFTVRGAFSIDRVYRTEGIDWFPNEELVYQEGLECLDRYIEMKPSVVISHDCPHSIRKHLFGIDQKSNTSNLLQAMFNEHQPDLWVFGHHHKSVNCKKGSTKFICLSELETLHI